MEKIISKNVLKGAVVLLIAVAMIFSTATVIADTKEENCSSASSKMSETYENHPQVQNTIMNYNSKISCKSSSVDNIKIVQPVYFRGRTYIFN